MSVKRPGEPGYTNRLRRIVEKNYSTSHASSWPMISSSFARMLISDPPTRRMGIDIEVITDHAEKYGHLYPTWNAPKDFAAEAYIHFLIQSKSQYKISWSS
jgi:hypothetical protein